ncbi:MAG TPA: hypothetical protein VFQ12_04120, partial [Thermoleophilaceae bacterium]|nr:hypothetical protein [Thermoleophilaceae bacterium]
MRPRQRIERLRGRHALVDGIPFSLRPALVDEQLGLQQAPHGTAAKRSGCRQRHRRVARVQQHRGADRGRRCAAGS